MNQNPMSNTVWEPQLEWFKDSSQYRTLDTIDGEPMEFEWNIFPGFSTLERVREVQKFMSNMGEPEQLDRKQSGTPLTKKDQEENWIKSLN